MSEETQVRLGKLADLKEMGWNYPNQVPTLTQSQRVVDEVQEKIVEPGSRLEDVSYQVAGRVIQLRKMGKAAFFKLRDQSGDIQVYIRKDDVSEDDFKQYKLLDVGDIVTLSGFPFRTKTGELTLHAKTFLILTKSLHPLPEKYHGLTDVETRYRQRYLDLISSPETKEVFILRSKIISQIRNFFNSRDYIEVETPTMSGVSSGAAARPFKTHHNALDLDLNMRIALELPLKRLVVGGIERVYEIGRVFRNEGLSPQHNPEFTMIEFYQAYATQDDLIELTEALFSELVEKVLKTDSIEYREKQISLKTPFKRITIQEAVEDFAGCAVDSIERVYELAKKHSCENVLQIKNYLEALFVFFDDVVADTIVQPTFVTKFPKVVSPLSRSNDSEPDYVDRFELYICGMEVANAFSELNDAADQRERFEGQMERKTAGEEEVMELDEDFVRALEYGLPPTAGQGIGIDRLVMLLTQQPTIRDVILFPTMRPTVSK